LLTDGLYFFSDLDRVTATGQAAIDTGISP
jgi:hypothetical protein